MNLTSKERFYLKILGIGATNAKTYAELKRKHNLIDSRRVFCSTIEALRNKGIAIGAIRSNRGGYYLIESESERQYAMNQYRAQMIEEMNMLDKLKNADLRYGIELKEMC